MLYIKRAMLTRVDPAAQMRSDLSVLTRTGDGLRKPDCFFLQCSDGDDWLKGGAGGLLCLCRIIKQWQGQVII